MKRLNMHEMGVKKSVTLSDGREIVYRTSFTDIHAPKDTPLIIFNNGLVCGNAWWTYTIQLFDSMGIHYLLHEYRGHFDGNYEDDQKKINLQQFAEDLSELIEYVAPSKILMVGHSMGVNVTLNYFLKHPHKVQAMALISGTPMAPGEHLFNFKYAQNLLPFLYFDHPVKNRICNALWKSSPYNLLALKLVHYLGTDPNRVPLDVIRWYMKDLARIDFRLFAQLVQQMENYNVLEELSRIDVPTLVVGGTKDPMCPLILQKLLHEHIKGSEFLALENSRHVPQIDNPELVNGRILSLLRKIA